MHSRVLGLVASVIVGAGLAQAQLPGPGTTVPLPANNSGMTLPQPAPNGAGSGPVYPVVPTLGDPVNYGGPRPAIAESDNDGPTLYGTVDYLLWQVQKGRIPPTTTAVPVGVITFDISDLVTLSPTGSPAFTGTSALGYAPASITNASSFGAGTDSRTDAQNGIRATFGFWVDSEATFGLEASGFLLERGADSFAAVSSQGGNQFLINTDFSRQLFLIQGGARVPLRTFDVFVAREATSSLVGNTANTLYGAEVNSRGILARIGQFDFGGIAGARFINFNDQMTLNNHIRLFLPTGFSEQDNTASLSRDLSFITRDRTRVYNYYFGGQLGVDMEWRCCGCFLYARAKLALGNMHQVADIDSTTQVINNDSVQRSPAGYTSAGGLLASPVDNGRHTRDRIAFVPEFNVKLGYQFTDWLRGHVGYDALQLNDVGRAGNVTVVNSLNSTVNVANSNNTFNVSQPTFRWAEKDVWIQGISFGLTATY